MRAMRKRAIETLFAAWLDGKPYSRWWEPMAGGVLDVSVVMNVVMIPNTDSSG